MIGLRGKNELRAVKKEMKEEDRFKEEECRKRIHYYKWDFR